MGLTVKILLAFFVFWPAFFSPAYGASDCIAFVPAGWQNEFWRKVARGAEDAGKIYGVTILVRAPAHDDSGYAQGTIVQNLMKHNCRGLIVAPIDKSINGNVAALLDKGIPTVYIDRGTDGLDDAKFLIKTDNYQAGWIIGEEVARTVEKGAKIGVLRMKKGVPSTEAREKGFIDSLKTAGFSINLDKYLGVTVGEVSRNTHRMMGEIRNMDVVFTPNEATTEGMLVAMGRETNLPRPKHIGFDSSDLILKAINSGELYATMVQTPYKMGYRSVEALMKLTDFNAKKIHVTTPTYLITRENMSSFQNLLN